MLADKKPGFPCRISLQDAEIGEEVILFHYKHHVTDSPYRASGAVFIRRAAKTAVLQPNEVPEMLMFRLLSLRGYNSDGIMQKALVTAGEKLQVDLPALFENQLIAYIHIHNAKEGCFHCLVSRS